MENKIVDILNRYWGHQSFRSLQEEIITSVIGGHDTIALLPTGGGKSVCFQVPAMAMEGICIVISPLIALMRDQVETLKKRGIKAIAINSSMSFREIDIALDNAVHGDIKFLYLSPERLKMDMVLARLPLMKVNVLAVDEAHCISEWGFDFRPAYREIAEIRPLLQNASLVALTATATTEVVKDITDQLQLKNPNIFKKSFTRKNLIYVVQEEQHKLSRLTTIVQKLGGSGIVYVSSRRETLRQAHLLRANGIAALPYHGGMSFDARKQTQELWQSNKAQIVVATNAFGMGIDKADVRFVVHLNLPQSVEAYFQEAGRAGRDEKLSYAIYLKNASDIADVKERAAKAVPTEAEIITVYRALTNHLQLALGSKLIESEAFDIAAFAKKYALAPVMTFNALRALDSCGVIHLSEGINSPSRVQFLLKGKELYSFEVNHLRFEKLIHLMLRSYEGLFEQATRISENNMAVRLKISAADVKDELRQLHQLRVLRYQEQTDLPFIAFPENRKRAMDLQLDRNFLNAKRKRIFHKINAIVAYAENPLICRSIQLVKYFGDKRSEACGKCDVCLARKRSELSAEVIESIQCAINKKLQSEDLPLQFVRDLKPHKPSEVIDVLRWMADNDLVQITQENIVRRMQPSKE